MSSQQRASPSTRLDRLQKFESQPVQITSRSRPASRTRPNCIQPVESKLVSIGSRHSRASLSRSRPTTRGRARLDRFPQVESQPTHIASSQLGLLTNSCCESHTQAKCHSSLIMTEKDHLPTNEHSVICHSKMVRITINQ